MEAIQPRPFAELLRRYRAAAGLTQEELAERAGLSSRGLSYLERGNRQPYRDTVRRLADALMLTEEERVPFVAAGRGLPDDTSPTPTIPAAPVVGQQIPSDSWIYVAHAQEDYAVVARLRADLRQQGIMTWVDEHDLPPGTPSWEQALRDAIRAATALLLIASPRTRGSRYIADELRIAELYQRRVYPIWIDGEQWMECVPLGWGGLQYLDARGAHYDAALATLRPALRQMRDVPVPDPVSVPMPSALVEAPRNPYKGLRPFTGVDAGDFFGREGLIESLIATLRSSEPSAPRFLALIGASGSGKSSVLLAGLLPRLQAGALPGSEAWIYLEPMVPGTHPLETFARTMHPLLPASTPAAVLSLLEESPEALHRLAAGATNRPGQRVVLVVDQCEELFATVVDEEERRRCINALVTGTTAPGGALLVLLTLRADFYDRPLRYPALGALLHAHSRVVLPPTLEELRRAIEGPAALPDVQLSFDEDLVGDLLFDLRGQAGALPLLQFTLDQLFARRVDRQLTGASYRALGGVRGALTRQAEATYNGLADDEQRRLARALFLRLIDPGLTEQDTTRRRAAITELVLPDPAETQRLSAVVDAFIAARLLVTTREHTVIEGDTGTTVEVSHEALIREWDRLGAWLHEARDDIRRQQTISADAAAWERHDRSADHLYRGSMLLEAELWAGRNTPSAQEAAFLAAAHTEHEHQLGEERDRQVRQLALTQQALTANQHAARRLRVLVGVLALFLAVAAALSVVAARGSLQARDAQRHAEAEAHAATVARTTLNEHDLALSANLATAAVSQLSTHYDLGLLLSVQAARTADTFTTQSTLLNALLAQVHPTLFLHAQTGSVRALAYSPEGHILAAGGDDHSIQLWNMASGKPIGSPLTGHTGAVASLAFSPDGMLLASGSADQTIRLWHRSGTSDPWLPLGGPLTGQQDQIRVVAFSPTGKLLVSSSWDGSIWLWDLSGSKPRGTPLTTLAGDIGALALSPDGKILAAGGQDVSTIQLWDVIHRRPLGSALMGQKGFVEQLAFSPDGKTLASIGNNGTLRLWDVRHRRLLGAPLTSGISPTSAMAFSHDGRILALANGYLTTLWNVATHRPIGTPLFSRAGAVYSVAFSPDGAVLATGDADHTIELWAVSSVAAGRGNPLATQLDNSNPITSVAASPTGAVLAAGDSAGQVRLWDVARRQTVGVLSLGHASSIVATAFSADGKSLAAAAGDGSIQLWDLATRRPIGTPLDARLGDLITIVFSPDGNILAAAYPDFTIRLWDVARRRQIGPPLTSQDGEIISLAFSPNGKILASGSFGAAVRFWNVATHRPQGAVLRGHTDRVLSLAFSPDGTLLASGSADHTVRLWDVALDRPTGTPLLGHTGNVWSVAFSPDGNELASGSADGTVRLWSVAYRAPIGPPLVMGSLVTGLAFTQAGSFMAAGSAAGPVWLWDMDVASWEQRACRIANRNLTIQEWQDYLGSAPYHQTCPAILPPK
jgi:WD40 repeat protein/transcriptional regulator with XRE-family HTH domain